MVEMRRRVYSSKALPIWGCASSWARLFTIISSMPGAKMFTQNSSLPSSCHTLHTPIPANSISTRRVSSSGLPHFWATSCAVRGLRRPITRATSACSSLTTHSSA